MLKRRVLTIVLAALLAVIGAGAVLAYVRQANNRAVAGLKTETVLEAKTNIPAGTTLRYAWDQGWLTTVSLPVGTLSANPVRAVNAGNGNKVLGATVGPGGLVLQPMLTTAAAVAANGGIVIPAGMVAVTIQVCLSQAVGGYVTAGSKVAVFDTYPIVGKRQGTQSVGQTCDVSHQSAVSGTNTRIVLTSAPVLAVGQSTSQGTSSGLASTVASGSASGANSPVLVTLAVNQADAERLILIDEVGLPYMALLSPSSKTAFDPNTPLQLFR